MSLNESYTEVYIAMKILENAVIPVIVFVCLFAIIWFMTRKSSTRNNAHYDEMQLQIRAAGYRMGFYVTLAGLLAVILLMECTGVFDHMLSPSFALGVVAFAGIVTFAVYCICKDAFYSVGQNRRTYIIICIIVVIANGIGMIGTIRERIQSENKMLSFSNSANLLCAVSFLVILIALLAKERHDRNEVAE